MREFPFWKDEEWAKKRKAIVKRRGTQSFVGVSRKSKKGNLKISSISISVIKMVRCLFGCCLLQKLQKPIKKRFKAGEFEYTHYCGCAGGSYYTQEGYDRHRRQQGGQTALDEFKKGE